MPGEQGLKGNGTRMTIWPQAAQDANTGAGGVPRSPVKPIPQGFPDRSLKPVSPNQPAYCHALAVRPASTPCASTSKARSESAQPKQASVML